MLVVLAVSGIPYLQFADRDTAVFTNPVAPDGHDPWVILHAGTYYYCYSHQNKIWVNRSDDPTQAVQFTGRVVWQPEKGKPYSHQLWAPELHRINNQWYIYVAASDGRNEHHRMYVLQGDRPDGDFKLAGRIASPSDRWAIDGTVLNLNSRLYFIWSGWEADVNDAQHLYISEMQSPVKLQGQRVRISSPEFAWETRNGRPRKDGTQMPLVNEGPEVLQRSGRTFLVYSASGSWTDFYCLGMLSLVGDDPMDPAAWIKNTEPVFSSTEDVVAPGHASFTTSPDGTQHWIVYHAAKYRGAGWNRQTHMQPFNWRMDGSPDFGQPVSPGELLHKPAIP